MFVDATNVTPVVVIVENAHVEDDHFCDLLCTCQCLSCQDARAEQRAYLAEEHWYQHATRTGW